MWRCLAAVAFLAGSGRSSGAGDVDGPAAVLSLPGGTLAGRLVDAPPAADGAPPTILWQSPSFVRPFEFPIEQIGGISFGRPAGGSAPGAAGFWTLELADGDVVVGRLEAIDDAHVTMSIGPAEEPVTVSVNRAMVRGISSGVAQSTYAWRGGLDGCETSAASHWRERAGGLASTTAGATLRIDAGEGDRVRYDLALAWDEPPRVRLGFGEFRIASRTDVEAVSPEAAYRIELAEEGLIVVRDEARPGGTGRADLEACGEIADGGLTLSVFIDRKVGRMVVVRPGRTAPLADLSIVPLSIDPERVPAESIVSADGFQIDVLAGAVILERLRIGPWSGGETQSDEDRPAAVELIGGKVIAGEVKGLSVDRGALVVAVVGAEGTSDETVAIDTVATIRLSATAASGAEGVSPRRIRVADRHGSSLTGDLVAVGEESVTIVHPAIDAPVRLPVALLAGMGAVEVATGVPQVSGRVGRLEMGDEAHDGCLVPISEEGAAAGLGAVGWLPLGSLNPAAFASGPDGDAPRATLRYPSTLAADGGDDLNGWIGVTIAEVDGEATITEVIPGGPFHRMGVVAPLKIRAVAPRGDGAFVPTKGLPIEDVMFLVQGRAGTGVQLRVVEGPLSIRRNLDLERGLHPIWGRDRQRLREVLRAQERLLARSKPKKGDQTPADRFRSRVILETGESVDGEVASIDDGGVRLLREGMEPVTIPGTAVKAVELVVKSGSLISPEKFRSLTTLPRGQRQSPPTHLVRSLGGDYLRGRVDGMDGETLRIALDADPRGKPLSIPRQEVARVIWLHPESLDGAWRPEAFAPAPGLPVDAGTDRDGRLRMSATGIEGNVLIGTHPFLGACRIDLGATDRLLIGGVLEETPRLPPYAQWRLQPAAEPRNLPAKQPRKP